MLGPDSCVVSGTLTVCNVCKNASRFSHIILLTNLN